MAQQSVSALDWAQYSADGSDQIAPVDCDFSVADTWYVTASGTYGAQGLKRADGFVVENTANPNNVTVTIGALVQIVPAFTREQIGLAGGFNNVVLQCSGGQVRVTFYVGTFHGSGSGSNQAAAAMAAVQNIPGVVFDFAGVIAPAGALVCDGSAISRTTYAALFANIGTTWGAGDGVSTFNIPNLLNRFTAGTNAGVGVTGGASTVALSAANLPPHTHGVPSATANVNNAAGATNTPTSSSATRAAAVTDNGPGASTPFSIIPPYAAVLKCIWY